MTCALAIGAVPVVFALIGTATACGTGRTASSASDGGASGEVGRESGAANCITSFSSPVSGPSDRCSVEALCSGTTYTADCDGGLCTCNILDGGPSKTVPFETAICTVVGNNPTPNANAASAACGWNL